MIEGWAETQAQVEPGFSIVLCNGSVCGVEGDFHCRRSVDYGRVRASSAPAARWWGERTKQNWLNVVSSSRQPGGSDEVRVRLSRCGVASVASSRSLEEWYLPERSRRQSSGSRSCCSRPTVVVQWRWCVAIRLVLTSSLVVSSFFCERDWISDRDFQKVKVNSLQSSDSISVIGRDQSDVLAVT